MNLAIKGHESRGKKEIANKAIFEGNAQSCDIMNNIIKNDTIKKDMKKINIAEILKNYPKGTKLYSPLCGECEFNGVYHRNGEICIEIITNTEVISCDRYGRYLYGINGEVIIFPSKENRDWSKFKKLFKNGDIVATSDGSWIGITTGGEIGSFIPMHCVIKTNGEFEAYFDKKETWQFHRLATEEEKEKLFQAIKDNGYRWDDETKTFEKLPKFKVGDKVKHKEDKIVITITGIKDDYYFIQFYNIRKNDYQNEKVSFKDQDKYELISNKFDISTLKPFDKVLVRDAYNETWKCDIYSHYIERDDYPYQCVSEVYAKCIPYEGNEHLLGTINNCDEYYKTWK